MIGEISKLERISKETIDRVIFFSKYLNPDDLNFLKKEFGFNQNDFNNLLNSYRNIGIVVKLNPISRGLSTNWHDFIDRVITKADALTKLNNVFVSLDYKLILILTNKGLMKIDLDKLNQKINMINDMIARHNLRARKQARKMDVMRDNISKVV